MDESVSLVQETHVLRLQLAAWAADPEWPLLSRYDLLGNKPPRSLFGRMVRWLRGRMAQLGLVRPHLSKYSWLPALKHAAYAPEGKTLLIWAPGVSRAELRRACDGFGQRLRSDSGLVPVLVTDVADFAYFSRLPWLIEYLPELSGEEQSYRERKQRYLAWRYREAMIVPVSAGLATAEEWEQILAMGGR